MTSLQALREAKKEAPQFLQCVLCDGIHPRYKCDAFKAMTLEQRLSHVQSEGLCVRCLREMHNGYCKDESCNLPCPTCAPEREVYHNRFLCASKCRYSQSVQASAHDEEHWN